MCPPDASAGPPHGVRSGAYASALATFVGGMAALVGPEAAAILLAQAGAALQARHVVAPLQGPPDPLLETPLEPPLETPLAAPLEAPLVAPLETPLETPLL